MGRLSQTKYYRSDPAPTVSVIRRHHPLHGRPLELLLSGGNETVTVRLPDGSSMKLPRRWTDIDALSCPELAGDSQISLEGLRELLSVFAYIATGSDQRRPRKAIGIRS